MITNPNLVAYPYDVTPNNVDMYPQPLPFYVPPIQNTTVQMFASQAQAQVAADPTDIVVTSTVPFSSASDRGTMIISGVTRDGNGNPLGGCTVDLFDSAQDVKIATTTSDPVTGVYVFASIAGGIKFYMVAYRKGSPDVAGTTLATVVAG